MFKNLKNYIVVASVALLSCTALTSCSDDDEEDLNGGIGNTVDVNSVFPKGNYKPSGISNITYNSDGLVSSITDDWGGVVTFQYFNVTSRAEEAYVLMTIDGEYECKMTLNNAGYVKYCVERELYDDEADIDYWWFEYNADGQLKYMKRSEGGNEVTNITYKNGDITDVRMVYEDENDDVGTDVSISYTNSKVSSPIQNLGGVMLWDHCFYIDMDEMKYAYYAGLLGKSTKHLPVLLTDHDYDNETESFDWILNSDGLPIEMIWNGEYTEETFTW